MSLGSAFEPKRLIGVPSGPIRNLVKFHLIELFNNLAVFVLDICRVDLHLIH